MLKNLHLPLLYTVLALSATAAEAKQPAPASRATAAEAKQPAPASRSASQTHQSARAASLGPPAHGKIVNGIPVPRGLMPYQVSLFRVDAGHFCGGTLIDAQWVLTAAHCIVWMKDDVSFRVLGGTNNLLHDGQVMEIEKVIVHELYDPATQTNDIALVKLVPYSAARDSDRARRFAPIAMRTTQSRQVAGPAIVSGYGYTAESGQISPQLLMADVPVVANEVCNAPDSYNGEIKDTMICAGGNAKDSCQGDSGGPLVVGDAQSGFQLIGVVSFGEGCARPMKYGIYTRVASYADWIQKITHQ